MSDELRTKLSQNSLIGTESITGKGHYFFQFPTENDSGIWMPPRPRDSFATCENWATIVNSERLVNSAVQCCEVKTYAHREKTKNTHENSLGKQEKSINSQPKIMA